MKQDATTYYVWIGGSCDYGHKERAGAAAVIVEQNGEIILRDVIADLHTTEFRMMLSLMVNIMESLPNHSDIIFLTNAAYIQNFDKAPTTKSANRESSESKGKLCLDFAESRPRKARANPDLVLQCIESKKRHNSVAVKIVPYHKSPLLIETHERSTEAMKKLRKEYNATIKSE